MDSDLMRELCASAKRVGNLELLEPTDASAVLKKVSDKFVADKPNLYWWASLKVPSVTRSYGSSDGLPILGVAISEVSNVYLVVTDDEQPPWDVFVVAAKDIVPILQGCRYFEYFVVANDFAWIVFDTHLNEFVCADMSIQAGVGSRISTLSLR